MTAGVFVTVGTQGPFDRLVGAVDRWAVARGRDDVFAQIGRAGAPPSRLGWAESLTPAEFDARVRDARAIVSHAGMGTIITALEYGKPVLVLPRRAALGEQRNDHQVDTARRFAELGLVRMAEDEAALPALLDEVVAAPAGGATIRPPSESLIRRIASFIADEPPRRSP